MKYNIVLLNDNDNELKNLINFFNALHDIELIVIKSHELFETYIKEHHIHLILANEKCVDLDPLSICQEIRSLHELNFLPFIYIMKDDDLELIKRAYEIGVNECTKSAFNLHELLLRIRRYILNYEALEKCLGQNERLGIVLATDQLTKVSNRMHFQTLLAQSIKEYKRYGRYFSIIYFHINDMQKINAIFGFTKGDKLLRDVAQFVAKSIRDSDVIARWGGGDFVILTPNTSINHANKLAFKLNSKLVKENFIQSFQIKVNYGLTQIKKEDDTYSIMDRGKKALYQSVKNHTKNIVVI